MNSASKRVQLDQIIQRLTVEATQNGLYPPSPQKIRPQSLHNFIMNSVDLAKSYLAHKNIPFSQYFVEYYISKYTSPSTAAQALYTYLRSWKHLSDQYCQPRLLAFCVEQPGCQQHFIRDYLKIRKQILIFTNQQNLLDDVALTHQQTLAVVHRIFDEIKKRFISKRLSELFINLNSRLINIAKLQSSVFVEFLISCKEQMSSLDQEVRITQHSRRGFANQNNSKSIFSSRIDMSNNGFFLNKIKANQHPPASGKLIYSKVQSFPTPKKSPLKAVLENEQTSLTKKSASKTKLSTSRKNANVTKEFPSPNIDSSPVVSPGSTYKPAAQIIRRFFQDTGGSPKSNIQQSSPGKQSRRGIMTYTKLRQNESGYPGVLMSTVERDISKRLRMNQVMEEGADNSYQSDKDISSYVAQKYSENWSRMLKVNENFKERMLRKSKEEYESSRLRVREGSLDYSQDRGIYFREDPQETQPMMIQDSYRMRTTFQ